MEKEEMGFVSLPLVSPHNVFGGVIKLHNDDNVLPLKDVPMFEVSIKENAASGHRVKGSLIVCFDQFEPESQCYLVTIKSFPPLSLSMSLSVSLISL